MSFVGSNTVADGIDFLLSITHRRKHLGGQCGAHGVMPLLSMLMCAESDVMEKNAGDQHVVIHSFFFPCNKKRSVQVAHDVGEVVVRSSGLCVTALRLPVNVKNSVVLVDVRVQGWVQFILLMKSANPDFI